MFLSFLFFNGTFFPQILVWVIFHLQILSSTFFRNAESCNYWGYGYKTQHSYPTSGLNHLKKARSEIWPKRSEEETTQKLLTWGQKVRNKKIKINSCLMVLQTSLPIYYRNNPSRKTVVVLFNPQLWGRGIRSFISFLRVLGRKITGKSN